MIKPEDFDQRLRALRDRKPFQPFQIEMEDGRIFVVGNREDLMYPQCGRSVYFHNGELEFVDCEYVGRIVELVPSQV
jgi:hypothetical protein